MVNQASLQDSFTVLNWQEARALLLNLNPQIVDIIDQLEPASHLKLYHLKLPFGHELIEKGQLNFNGLNVPETYQEQISSMGILLNKQMECYINIDRRVIPYALIKPGNLFGGWAQLIIKQITDHYSPWFRWSLSAGLRSLFFLSKISDRAALERMKRVYPFKAQAPQHPTSQWHIFKEIAHYEDKWQAEVLLFDRNWFISPNDLKWAGFYFHTIHDVTKRQGFLLDMLRWQIVFSSLREQPNFRYPEYISDIVKQLFAIGVGGLPGFTPMTSEAAGPLNFLQYVFQHYYQLKYLPTMIGLDQFNNRNEPQAPLYYSLQYPSAVEYSGKLISSTNAKALVLLHHVIKKYLAAFSNETASRETPNLHRIAKIIHFNFYHYHNFDRHVSSTYDLVEQDQRFLELGDNIETTDFPYNASFLNGCIKITL